MLWLLYATSRVVPHASSALFWVPSTLGTPPGLPMVLDARSDMLPTLHWGLIQPVQILHSCRSVSVTDRSLPQDTTTM